MKLIAIAAMTAGRVIGNAGTIPWTIPEEMAHFKRTTKGHIVIMGRKTWESIPERFRPLPGRENWVITSDREGFKDPAHAVFASPRQALQEVRRLQRAGDARNAYVIGGGTIYDAFLPFCEELVLSMIHADYEGDTQFPRFDHLFDLQPFSLDQDQQDAGFSVFRHQRAHPRVDGRLLQDNLETARYTIAELVQQVRYLAARLDDSNGNEGARINAFRLANRSIDVYAHLAPLVPHMPGEQQGVGDDSRRWGTATTPDPYYKEMPAGGTKVELMAPKLDAVRGKTIDQLIVDDAQEFDPNLELGKQVKEVVIEAEDGSWRFDFEIWPANGGFGGKLVKGMQEKSPYIPPDEAWCEEHDQSNAAIDGVESMALAYLCATGGVATDALREAVTTAMEAIATHYY